MGLKLIYTLMTDKDFDSLYGYIKIPQLLQIAIAASVKHN